MRSGKMYVSNNLTLKQSHVRANGHAGVGLIVDFLGRDATDFLLNSVVNIVLDTVITAIAFI